MTLQEIKNTIIRGENALKFPLRIDSGWISDANGNHILDVRGWGYLQYADNDQGAVIQDAIGRWVVDTLNDAQDQSRRELLEDLLITVQEDVNFGAQHQQTVSTKAQSKIMTLLRKLS